MRLLALCWIGFLLVFFTFSSTQEYYSMPCYPALALLIGCALAERRLDHGRASGDRCRSPPLPLVIIAVILIQVWNLPTPGDISNALTQQHPEAYTLSLGHMGDLTLQVVRLLAGAADGRRPGLLIGASAPLLASATDHRHC